MDNMARLRPVCPEDESFLYEVYAGTRLDELALTGWSEQQINQFLHMQFDAQHRYYQQQFPEAEFHIILLKNQPIGRLYVDRRSDEIRIIDIALLPEYRNAGIGSILLHKLMDEAEESGRAVRIHVEAFNPALRLYRRLGFRRIEDHGVYLLMEWSPVSAQKAPPSKQAAQMEPIV